MAPPVKKRIVSAATKTVPAKVPPKRAAKAATPTAQPPGPALNLPDGTSEEIEPSRLLLDPGNLRLLEKADRSVANVDVKLIGQKAIQEKLYSLIKDDPQFDIKSLESSIAYNGFLKHERLIVARYDGEKFLVLEGNRRVTTVRKLFEVHGPRLDKLTTNVRESLKTLPCFVLDGPTIDGSLEKLKAYRRASEIYIGMRHLMGARSWEPASRYEFQAKLIFEEGWKPEQVAARFGRKRSEVDRDLRAQRLYQDFVEFERKLGQSHSLTYNAFAEASRAPNIMTWLGWSKSETRFTNRKREEVFFHYLISALRGRLESPFPEGEEETPEVSAETVVRTLRDMLKLKDESIESAIEDRDFVAAAVMFEDKKEGSFVKRVAAFTRTLKRVTGDELEANPAESKAKLLELSEQVKKTVRLLDALL